MAMNILHQSPHVQMEVILSILLTQNSIADASRGWANGVRDAGNAVKDASAAAGSRAPTAQNPLGLSRSPQSVQLPSSRSKAGGKPPSRSTARDPLGLGSL